MNALKWCLVLSPFVTLAVGLVYHLAYWRGWRAHMRITDDSMDRYMAKHFSAETQATVADWEARMKTPETP